MATVKLLQQQTSKKDMVSIDTGYNKINVLIDSGAIMPVWNKSVIALQTAFPDCEKTEYYCSIGGFGGDGKGKYQEIWKIPQITLNCFESDNELHIHNLFVAVYTDIGFLFDLLLSAPVFANVNRHNMFAEKPKYIEIEYTHDIQCLPDAQSITEEVIDGERRKTLRGITSFLQDPGIRRMI